MSAALTPISLPTIAATPATLRALLGGLPDSVTLEVRDEGGWSTRDVVAHLLDRWKTQWERVDAMLAEERPALANHDETASLDRSGYRQKPLGSLLLDLERARRQALPRYQSLAGEQLARTGEHSAAGPVSVAEMLNHIAYHDLDHLRQIASLLASVAHEGRGVMQQL